MGEEEEELPGEHFTQYRLGSCSFMCITRASQHSGSRLMSSVHGSSPKG